MDYFGLNFSANAFQVAQIVKNGKELKLVAVGEISNPTKQLVDFSSQDPFAAAIHKLLTGLAINIPKVVVSIPEEMVVSRIVKLPAMKESEIITALHYEAEAFIPYPIEEAQIDYQIVKKENNGSQRILVVATRRRYLENINNLLGGLNLVPLAVENYALSLNRAVCPFRRQPTLVMDIGNRITTLVLAMEGNIHLTRTIPIGGQAFTRVISVALGMDLMKAEAYKRTYGLKTGKWQNKIRKSLLPIVEQLVSEARKTMLSFKEEWRQRPDLLVLSGGGALIPNLSDELVQQLNVEVQWGEPLRGVTLGENAHVPADFAKIKLQFAGVIGLALREWRQ